MADSVARKGPSLGVSALWFAIPYCFALLSYFGVNALAGRMLGLAGFGRFTFVITATVLLGQLGLLGLHRAGLRAAAKLSDGVRPGDGSGSDPDDLESQLRGVRVVNRILLPATGLLAAVGALWMMPTAGRGSWAIPCCVFLLVVLSGQQRLWANYLRGFGQVRLAGLLEGRSGGALVAVCQVLLLSVVWLVPAGYRLPAALAAMALGYLVPILAVRQRVTGWFAGVTVAWRPLADLALAWRRGVRFAVIQAGSYLNTNLDLWIGVLLLSHAAGSRFAAVMRLVLLVLIPLTSMQIVFSPVIARLHARGELADLERLLRTAATLIAVVMFAMLIPMLIAPGLLLGFVYGEGFAAAGSALVIVSLGMVVQVLGGMCAPALSMTTEEAVTARVHGIAIVARSVCGVLGATLFGVIGLATASAVITAGTAVWLWVEARRRLGIWTHPTPRPRPRLIMRTRG